MASQRKGVSVHAFAKFHGKSDTSARKHLKNGNLKLLPDGSVDPKQPWPGIQDEGEEGGNERVEVDADLDLDTEDLEGLFGEHGSVTLTDARKTETVIRAQLRKLRLQKELKELVPLAHVQKHIERIAINIKQTILHIPSRHASQIAAKLRCDPVALEAELTKAVTEELNAICAPSIPAD